jgi:hypothetical protein
MQLEGTEAPTALTPNSAGDGGTLTPANNTTRSNVVILDKVHIYGDVGPATKTPTSSPANETQNSAPQTSVDTKQSNPESISPVTQTQRSEATVPSTQDTSGNSGSISSSTTQNNRGNGISPQVLTSTPTHSFNLFDSSVAGTPRREQLNSSFRQENITSYSQETRIISYPAYGKPPTFPTDEDNDPKAFGVRTMWTTIPSLAPAKHEATKNKKGTKKDKKKTEKPFTVIPYSLPSPKPIPKDEEETAKEEAEKVMKKLDSFNGHNLGKPIPLTPEELKAIMLYEYLLLRKRNTLFVFRANADGYFFIDLSREYYLTKQIGDVPPGIYGSSDINYYYLGLVSATDNRTEFGDSAVIGGYNMAQGLPGFFTGNIDSIVHNFNQADIGPSF